MAAPKIADLSDDELLSQLQRACFDANVLNVRIIYLLIEVEDRRLHLLDACSSMFDFCTNRLDMSEGAAYLRIAAARLVRRFPMLAPRIERGELHLSTLVRLRDYLTEENIEELVEVTRKKNRRQVMDILASRMPRPDVPPKPARLRKLPTVKTANEISAAAERHIEAVAETRYRLALTMSREERDELLFVRDLMMHRNPSGDLNAVVMKAVRLLRKELERQRFATTSRPQSRKVSKTEARAKGSEEIPRAVRREVFERDGRRCAFKDAKGRRCSATTFLEVDHIVPRALGGSNDVENLRVCCRAHNCLHAEAVFGKEYVSKKIRLSQLKSRRRKAGAAASPGQTPK